jgi:antibiotic biosynthesis monooxygenase (ABM) superfamily enzyme
MIAETSDAPETPSTVSKAAPETSSAAPSVHVRAFVTWLAIFPIVAVGMSIMAPFADSWPPVLRSLVLTAAVVPLAVYLVVPNLLKLYTRWIKSRTS